MRVIKPLNNNGSIQIKFTVNGSNYRFTPIPGARYDDPGKLSQAIDVCTQIALDIKNNQFFGNLEKYTIITNAPKRCQLNSLFELVKLWIEDLDVSEETKANHYKWLLKRVQIADPKVSETTWLNRNMTPSSFNKMLSMLNQCFKWAIKKCYVTDNPWNNLRYKKIEPKIVNVFTHDERIAIFREVKENHQSYYLFVLFLFMTGCRISEAIGFTWDKIDFEKNEILISSSYSLDKLGDGYKRVMKSTKTGAIIYQTLDPSYIQMLKESVRLSDFVFVSPRGKSIASGNFRRDCWIPVLKKLKINFRKIHTTRHTFGSEGIEQGISITGVAYLLGHKNIAMVSKTYAHLIDRPKTPEIKIN